MKSFKYPIQVDPLQRLKSPIIFPLKVTVYKNVYCPVLFSTGRDPAMASGSNPIILAIEEDIMESYE
jgi:hypothetical protein